MKNRETLKWIYQRIRRYFPLVLLISLTTALSAVSAMKSAVVSRLFLLASNIGFPLSVGRTEVRPTSLRWRCSPLLLPTADLLRAENPMN